MLEKIKDKLSSSSSSSSRPDNAASSSQKTLPTGPFSKGPIPPSASTDRSGAPLPDPYAKWGVPTNSAPTALGRTAADVPAEHPVHAMSAAEQEKLERKGVNPVLKAEMDEAVRGKGDEEKKGVVGWLDRKMAGGGWGGVGVDGGGM